MASNPKDSRATDTTQASPTPQSQTDVGGMPANVQHGLFDGAQGSGPQQMPIDGDWAERADAGTADQQVSSTPERQMVEGTPPAHIDSPLESIGKAITEPVLEAFGEADKRGEASPGSPPDKIT